VEKEILTAFEEIHDLNVIHGDVRMANILVAESGNKVWIIDFEDGEIIEDGDERLGSLISNELDAVHEMLRDIREGAVPIDCLPPRENGISTMQVPSLRVC
jgi:RIO-like serine/threonine protein kinase